MDPKLFLPLVDNKIFPESVRLFFRFGVAEFKSNLDNDVIKKQAKIVRENSVQPYNEQDKEINEHYTFNDEKKRLYEGRTLSVKSWSENVHETTNQMLSNFGGQN